MEDEKVKICRKCEQFRNCRTFWGMECRERGGRKIPAFKNPRKATPDPDNYLAKVVWLNGEREFITEADLVGIAAYQEVAAAAQPMRRKRGRHR